MKFSLAPNTLRLLRCVNKQRQITALRLRLQPQEGSNVCCFRDGAYADFANSSAHTRNRPITNPTTLIPGSISNLLFPSVTLPIPLARKEWAVTRLPN